MKLITKSLKYAFPAGRAASGEPAIIHVELVQSAGQVKLCVRDNGVGLPDAPLRRDGMGLELVKMLARQIHSSLTVDGSSGCSTCLMFPGE